MSGKIAIFIASLVVALCLSVGVRQAPCASDMSVTLLLDREVCHKFQQVLDGRGYGVRVVGAIVYGKVSQIKQKTYVALMRCVESKGNVFILGMAFRRGVIVKIHTRETGDRYLQASYKGVF